MIFVGLDDRENCSEKCFGENAQLFLKQKKQQKFYFQKVDRWKRPRANG